MSVSIFVDLDNCMPVWSVVLRNSLYVMPAIFTQISVMQWCVRSRLINCRVISKCLYFSTVAHFI